MANWYSARVSELRDLTPTVRSFTLDFPNLDPLEFRPGQFITLDLPVGERRRDGWRSYSIASPPDGTNRCELCIVHLPEGRGTGYLFDEINPGDELRSKAPGGVFVLSEKALDLDELVFICTGTGVAPFRSMLLDLDRRGVTPPPIHLIFGCRTPEDVLYADEFTELAARQPWFTYTVALSRTEATDDLPYAAQAGYVHPVYAKLADHPHPGRRFYLCGWQQMIDEAVERLEKLGYGREQIVFELYG